MNTFWRLIDSGRCDAAYNMAVDEAIAINVRGGDLPPTLRLYGWLGPSVSLGSFQKITDINLQYCIRNNIPVVRRPTGGRGILHDDELTYSFSSKNEGEFSAGLLETYRKLSAAFQFALNKIGLNVTIKMRREAGRNLTRSPLCFQSTSYGEISFDGKKLIGSAQKRWSDGFLQQGSIPYSINYEKLTRVFNINNEPLATSADRTVTPPLQPIIEVNSVNSVVLWGKGKEGKSISMVGLKELLKDLDDKRFKEHIKSAFEEVFNITLVDSQLSPREEELALRLLSEKYQNTQWTHAAAGNSRFCNSNEKLKRALQG